MRPLTRFVQFCFGLQAIHLIASVVGLCLALFVVANTSTYASRYVTSSECLAVLVAGLVVVLFDLAPAVAWWTLRKRKPAARGWALAAGVANLLVSIPGLSSMSSSGWIESILHIPAGLIHATIGIAALVAFRRPIPFEEPPAAPPKPLRLPGDGTSRHTDRIAWIVGLGLLWVQFAAWARWNATRNLPQFGVLIDLLLFQLALDVSVLVHELGHAVAGWASDMALRSFHLGPFSGAIRDGYWRFRINLKQILSAGAVGMAPKHLRNVRGRQVFMLMGGPAGSLVLAGVATTAALSAPDSPWQPAWSLLSMISAVSWAAVIVNLIPQNPEGHYSDGAQIYQMVTLGPWADVHLSFAMVASSLTTSIAPRDWDINLIRRAADFLTRGERALLLRVFAGQHCLDAGRIPEALTWFQAAEDMYEEVKLPNPSDLVAELVFVNAAYRRDRERAERWWQRIGECRPQDMDADYWKASACIFWLHGRIHEAREDWDRGERLAAQLPSCGAYDHTRRAFEYLRVAMESPAPQLVALAEAIGPSTADAQPAVAPQGAGV